MLSIKHVTSKRSLFAPILALNHTLFAAAGTSAAAVEPSAALFHVHRRSPRSRATVTRETASALKEWLIAGHDRLLFTIFEILKSGKGFERQAADQKLTLLNLQLSVPFVLQALNYGKRLDHGVLLCVKFFDWAGRQPKYHHTRAAYHAMFKILASAKQTSKIIDYTENFIANRYSLKVRFYDTLVMGYALAGKPDVALGVFSRMRFQGLDLDGFGYHVLLNALVEESCFDAVQVIEKQISNQGLCNSTTHSIMLKSLFKQNRVVEAEGYLRRLVREGKKLDPVILGWFVHALCIMKKFQEACSLIEEFRDMKLVPMDHVYGVYLSDLVQGKQLDKALNFLQTMKCLEGYIPNVSKYNILMIRLLKVNWLKDVRDLLLDMKENQVSPDRWTFNVALCLFCKAGMVEDALELYNAKGQFRWAPTNIATDSLLRMLCKYNRADDAFEILKSSVKQGCPPTKWGFSAVVDALCSELKLDEMTEVLELAAQKPNCMPCPSTYHNVILALCEADRVEEARYFLHKLNEGSNMATWSCYFNLISGYKRSNKVEKAVELLIEARQKNYSIPNWLFRSVIHELCKKEEPFRFLTLLLSIFRPWHFVYNWFIDGLGRAKKSELAKFIEKSMTVNAVHPTQATHILMVHCYLRSNRFADAIRYFNNLHIEGQVSKRLYCSMVVGLCKAGKLDFALDVLHRMRTDGVVPNLECSEVLVNKLCQEENYDAAVKVVTDLEKDRKKVSTFIGNTLLLHSLSSRKLYEAWVRHRQEVDPMFVGSALHWLLGVFCGKTKMPESFSVLEDTIGECFEPDIFTCNMVLKKLAFTDIDHACHYFDDICRRGYEPNRWTIRILIEGLHECRRFDAVRFLEDKYGSDWMHSEKEEQHGNEFMFLKKRNYGKEW